MPHFRVDLFWAMIVHVCAPLALVSACGFLVDRKFRLDFNTLVSLNLRLFVPAFIFVRLSSAKTEHESGAQIMGFTLAVIGSMFLLAVIAGRIMRLSREKTRALQLAVMFYNCGNWGVPLIALAFGENGLSVQVFVLATMNVCTFTIGLFLAHSQSAGGGRNAFSAVVRQPSIYAILAALIVRATGWEPWNDAIWLWGAAKPLADALPGIALVTLGAQLSKTRPPRPDLSLSAALIIRLVGGPLVALGLCVVFGLDPLVSAILIAGASAPTAVNTALLAHECRADTTYATGAVFYSTLISLISTAVFLAWMRGAGWF